MGSNNSLVSMAMQSSASRGRTTANDAYGKRLVPHIIDQTASQNPQKECFQIPYSSLPEDGWRTITFKQFANAINKCCHQIIAQCGEPGKDAFPTIAYIGPNDARYLVLLLAAVKTGYKILFISPRNSEDGQLDLFERTDCHFLAFPGTHQRMVEPWLLRREMKAMEIDPVDTWFPEVSENIAHYPFDKTFEEAEWDPLCVLHTSGSTGLPKPIVVRQGMVAIMDAYHGLGEWEGMNFWMREWAARAPRLYMTMPLFHAAGIYACIMTIAYWDVSVALGVTDRPLSADLVLASLDNLDVQGAFLPPSILEDMSQDQEGIRALAKLNIVGFGGGSLAPESGNRLVKGGVYLSSVIASTECCVMPIYCNKDPSMWQWFNFRLDKSDCEWRKQGTDEIYEQVIVRQGKGPGLQPYFYTFPEKNEVSTKDLYRPHPELPNCWMYHGRADDTIVFSNGEKLNPVSIEGVICGHPEIKGALVVGSKRFQPGLILEPMTDHVSDQEQKKLIDSVWPLVLQANEETVTHGRISRDLVMVSNPTKPFLRAGKGTIQRALTVKLYTTEIDALYEMASQATKTDISISLDVSSEEALISCIGNLFHDNLGGIVLEPDTDFFSAGIDSLQIISATRLLHSGLEAAGHIFGSTALNTRVLYNNATPRRLARYIMNTIVSGGNDGSGGPQEAMAALLQKYTRDLHRGRPGRPNPSSHGQTVLLTGSTGSLGSYLLDAMVRSPYVGKVICLNRAPDGGVAQQEQSMADRGLDAAYRTKAEFYRADVSQADFGLPADVYERLLREVDRMVLNAWPVNFNLAVESFEPHLRGVRHFADLAARAEKRVAVQFISSISTVSRWDARARGPVPEERLEDLRLAGDGGYGASKLVASLILHEAATVGDFPAAVIRVGQIAGPDAGAGVWNRHEWFPSIVASSLYLKAFPSDLGSQGRVDWTPVERIARLVLEVGGITREVDIESVQGYYHGVNPSATTWAEIADAIRDFYGEERLPEMVPFQEWVKRLEMSEYESDAKTRAAMKQNPGIKLLDTYRDIAHADHPPVTLAMKRTAARSPTMRQSDAITSGLIHQWCKHWDF